MSKNIRQKKHTVFVVDADGVLVVYANGVVSSDDKELVKTIRSMSERKLHVKVKPYGRQNSVEANLNGNHMNILAALMSAKPGRTRVLEAPDDIMNFIYSS